MTKPINVRKETNYVSAIIVDPHGEYDIDGILRSNGITVRHIFDGFTLDNFATDETLEDICHKIINAYPKSKNEFRDDDNHLYHIYRVYGTNEDHIRAVEKLVMMLLGNVYTVSGDDSYFDYFPNTAEAVRLYAESLGLVDLLKPLTVLVFSEDSPYIHSEGYENAYDLFSDFPGAP